MDRKGITSDVLKIGAAMLIAISVFVLLTIFALGPSKADSKVVEMGDRLLHYTQNTSLEILKHE